MVELLATALVKEVVHLLCRIDGVIRKHVFHLPHDVISGLARKHIQLGYGRDFHGRDIRSPLLQFKSEEAGGRAHIQHAFSVEGFRKAV